MGLPTLSVPQAQMIPQSNIPTIIAKNEDTNQHLCPQTGPHQPMVAVPVTIPMEGAMFGVRRPMESRKLEGTASPIRRASLLQCLAARACHGYRNTLIRRSGGIFAGAAQRDADDN